MLDVVLEVDQGGGEPGGVLADPAVGDLLDRDRVEESRLLRPSLDGDDQVGLDEDARCFITPNRLIRSANASHTSPTVWPSRVNSRSRISRRVGSASARKTASWGSTPPDYVTIWSQIKRVLTTR